MKKYILKYFCISFIVITLIFNTGCENSNRQIENSTAVTTPFISETAEMTSEESTEPITEETTVETTTSPQTTIATTTEQTTVATTTQAITTEQTTTQEQTSVETTTEPPQTEGENIHNYDLSEICVPNPFTSADLPDNIETAEDVVDLRVYAEMTGETEIEAHVSTFEEDIIKHIYSDGLINDFEIQYIDISQPVKCIITFSEEYRIYQAILSKNTNNLSSKELQVYNKVYEIVNSIVDKDDSDYNNAKALHDYIINTTKYVHADDDKTSYGALINGKAVCTGYSEAYWLLCNASGIPCRIITGSAGGENHQWNIIYVDGQWLYTDVTWDDPVSQDSKDILTYEYFASEENLKNHTFDICDLRL